MKFLKDNVLSYLDGVFNRYSMSNALLSDLYRFLYVEKLKVRAWTSYNVLLRIKFLQCKILRL